MEEAAKNTAGVKDATVNFMMLKMIVEFEDGQDPKGCYAGSPEELQESRRRLRDLLIKNNGGKAVTRACLKKAFLQDVRYNLWEILSDEGAVAGYGN